MWMDLFVNLVNIQFRSRAVIRMTLELSQLVRDIHPVQIPSCHPLLIVINQTYAYQDQWAEVMKLPAWNPSASACTHTDTPPPPPTHTHTHPPTHTHIHPPTHPHTHTHTHTRNPYSAVTTATPLDSQKQCIHYFFFHCIMDLKTLKVSQMPIPANTAFTNSKGPKSAMVWPFSCSSVHQISY